MYVEIQNFSKFGKVKKKLQHIARTMRGLGWAVEEPQTSDRVIIL